MKKTLTYTIAALIVALVIGVVVLGFANSEQDYNYTMVHLPDGEVVEGPLTSYVVFPHTERIALTITGTKYYTAIDNVVLIAN